LTAADGIYTPVNLVSSPDCTGDIQGMHSWSGNETTVNQTGKGYHHFGFEIAFRVWE